MISSIIICVLIVALGVSIWFNYQYRKSANFWFREFSKMRSMRNFCIGSASVSFVVASFLIHKLNKQ